jgi:hypothetical protein
MLASQYWLLRFIAYSHWSRGLPFFDGGRSDMSILAFEREVLRLRLVSSFRSLLISICLLFLSQPLLAFPVFYSRSDFAAGSNPVGIAIGDLDGDGTLDLTTANVGSDDVSVLLGNGDGTFQKAVHYNTAGEDCYAIAIGDLNGDGAPDLTVANWDSHDVSVLLGNGDGTFPTAVTYPVGSDCRSVAIGDLDGDGNRDLAVGNSKAFVSPAGVYVVSVLFGNGDGTFQTAVHYATGGTSRYVEIEDVNRDGDLDLATANWHADSASVLLGNGDGTFQEPLN